MMFLFRFVSPGFWFQLATWFDAFTKIQDGCRNMNIEQENNVMCIVHVSSHNTYFTSFCVLNVKRNWMFIIYVFILLWLHDCITPPKALLLMDSTRRTCFGMLCCLRIAICYQCPCNMCIVIVLSQQWVYTSWFIESLKHCYVGPQQLISSRVSDSGRSDTLIGQNIITVNPKFWSLHSSLDKYKCQLMISRDNSVILDSSL